MAAFPRTKAFVAQQAADLRPVKDVQKPLLEAVLTFLDHVHYRPVYVRVMAYFLLWCGVSFSQRLIARACRYSERSLRLFKQHSPERFAQTVLYTPRHNPGAQPKLRPEYLGPVVSWLLGRPRTTYAEVAEFLQAQWAVTVSPLTVKDWLTGYGLNRLCRRAHAAPLF